jgi:secreted trypsin-like serine protease
MLRDACHFQMNTYYKITILSITLLLAACDSSSSRTADNTTINPRILNGTEVAQQDAPSMVPIRVELADGTYQLCSGTAIGAAHVLTAAHCFDGIVTRAVVTANGTEVAASSFTIAPGYAFVPELLAIFNDLAVLSFELPLGLPILPLIASAPIVAETIHPTYGFGINEDGNFGVLRSGEVQIAIATENHIFTTPFDGGGQNPCLGDSGGPLISFTADLEGNPQIYGIAGLVSSGTVENCEEGDVTLYTNLQNIGLLSFLASIVPDIVIV